MIFDEKYEVPDNAYRYKPIEYELGGPKGDCWECTSHDTQKLNGMEKVQLRWQDMCMR